MYTSKHSDLKYLFKPCNIHRELYALRQSPSAPYHRLPTKKRSIYSNILLSQNSKFRILHMTYRFDHHRRCRRTGWSIVAHSHRRYHRSLLQRLRFHMRRRLLLPRWRCHPNRRLLPHRGLHLSRRSLLLPRWRFRLSRLLLLLRRRLLPPR